MSRPKFETLMRYRLWRNWWGRTLKNRPNKLYDFETGKPMELKKRIFKEMPKTDDLFKFFIDMGVLNFDVSYDNVQQNFRCELFKPDMDLRIVVRGLSAAISVETATIQFLKAKVKR